MDVAKSPSSSWPQPYARVLTVALLGRLPKLGRKVAQRIGRQEQVHTSVLSQQVPQLDYALTASPAQAPGKLGNWDVRSSHVCRATVDDPDIKELVKKLKAMVSSVANTVC